MDTDAGTLLRQLTLQPGQGVLNHRPELAQQYAAFIDCIWAQPSPSRRVLELCHRRITAIHGQSPQPSMDYGVALTGDELKSLQRGDFAPFSADEQLALAVAELMPYNHHAVTDVQMHACEQAFGAAGAVNLLVALAFFDVNCRLQLTLQADQL